MHFRKFVRLCVIFGGGVAIAACSTAVTENQPSSLTMAASPTPGEASPEQAPPVSHPIRLVDFSNSVYPWVSDLGDPRKSFTLQNGKLPDTRDAKGMVDGMGVFLRSIVYGDVTGDESEEAIVALSILTGGSAIPYVTYIYTLIDAKPKLLWAFSTGDRADGGLRQVYAENGELVIELYGKGKIIGGDLYAEDGMTGGDCCPTHFTLARYQWQDNRFQQKGKEEILSNPVGGAPVVMPRYDSSK